MRKVLAHIKRTPFFSPSTFPSLFSSAMQHHPGSEVIARLVCLLVFACLVPNRGAPDRGLWSAAVECQLLQRLAAALDRFPRQEQLAQIVPALLTLSTRHVDMESRRVIELTKGEAAEGGGDSPGRARKARPRRD